MKALRRYLPEIDLDEDEIPAEVLEKMEVKWSISERQSKK